jgi:hypothetical protein
VREEKRKHRKHTKKRHHELESAETTQKVSVQTLQLTELSDEDLKHLYLYIKKIKDGQALVAHTCNPRQRSGGS